MTRIGNGDEPQFNVRRNSDTSQGNIEKSKFAFDLESIITKAKNAHAASEVKTEDIDLAKEMGFVRQDNKKVPLNRASVTNLPTIEERRPMSAEEADYYGKSNHPDSFKEQENFYHEIDNSDGTKSFIFKFEDPEDGSTLYYRNDVKYNDDGSFVVGTVGGVVSDLKSVFLDSYYPHQYFIYDKDGNLTKWLNGTTENYVE